MAHFGVNCVDNGKDLKVVEREVKEETRGPGQLLGYRLMHKKLREHRHLAIPQGLVYDAMMQIDLEGSQLEDSTHIVDSLGPESLELLYESSFGARIFVCSPSGSRRCPSQDSEFYSFWTWGVLFGFLARFLGFDMGHPGLKLG